MTQLLTHQPITEFVEVDWLDLRSGPDGSLYRHCEFCGESYLDDKWNERPIRRFFELLGEGLIACEHCLPNIQEPNHDRH